jgi:hypothetical protein
MNNNIELHYVNYDFAKFLKEKGFNVPCKQAFYGDVEDEDIEYNEPTTTGDDFILGEYDCYAPEQHVVVEWLRVNYGIWVYPLPIDDEMKLWQCRIVKGQPFSNLKNTLKIINHGEISYRGLYSPQEAYSAAFDYIKNNNLI